MSPHAFRLLGALRPEDSNADEEGRHAPQPELERLPMARVLLAPTAARELAGLPRTVQSRMVRVFERLERWPNVSGAKPLRGELAGSFRIRTGDYRLVFRVEGERVVVERIALRRDIYED